MRTRRRPTGRTGWVVALAAALALSSQAGLQPTASAAPRTQGTAYQTAPAAGDRVDLVNTFIGTRGDGNTFPGATTPFGMVQLSPDTGHYAGYRYDDPRIRGFSLTHVSGVGCGLGGDQPMLPMTGRPTSTDAGAYALPYRHETEQASPGSYAVTLDDPDGAVEVELTATTRTGSQRWTFEPSADSGVLINTGQALHGVSTSSVRVVDARTIETTVTGASFCRDTEPYTLHLLTTFDRDVRVQTFEDDRYSEATTTSGPGRRGAWVSFDTRQDHDVVATTALSWVDADGARANLEAEAGDFDDIRDGARQTWESYLDRVDVEGGTAAQQRTFYSSLYRALIGPSRADDVDGRYRGWDDAVHTADGHGYYQTSSLWDTYRTQIQLLGLVAPQEARDQTISLVLQSQQSGWLPRWGWATVETNIMTGDPVTPQIVTAQQYGLLEGWEQAAWTELVRNADGVPPADHPSNGRAGNEHYLAHGYVPHRVSPCSQPGDCDFDHGGSATLEYAVADAAMAVMAKATGHERDYRRYADRSRSWRSVFTPDTHFPRARDVSGSFVGNPDPAWSEGFHEGTAWQYQWLVPQDLPGLIAEIGGEKAANARLDEFFAYDQLVADPEGTAREVWINDPYAYYGTTRYNPQNEPDLHAPYVYLWTGQPWKTADVVRAALLLFRDGPDGITGNDDVGTMSSWHVLSSLGLYPATAGTDQLVIGSPVFDRATLHLSEPFGGGDLVISAPGTSEQNRYVQSVTLDGKKHPQTWLSASELAGGAQLTVQMGARPSTWGVKANTRAPAPVPGRGPGQREDLGVSLRTDQPTAALNGTERVVEATATVTVVSRGSTHGTVAVAAPSPLAVAPTRSNFTVKGDGTPQVVSLPVQVTVPAGTPAGDYDVTATATVAGRSAASTLRLSVVDPSCSGPRAQCPLDLAGQLDLDGVAPSSGAGSGSFDGQGWAFAQELLPAPGLRLVQDTAVTVPDTSGSAPNFTAGAATVPVGMRADRLTFLASSANGDARDVPVTLTYADGGTTATRLSVTDWCAGSARFGDRLGVRTPERVELGRGLVGPACSLWLVDLEVDGGRELSSVSWDGGDRLRVMAVTARRS